MPAAKPIYLVNPGVDDPKPWAIYCRLSRKKYNRPGRRTRRSEDETVERQERENRAYAGVNGLPLSDALVFVDNNYSAWKGHNRPEFDRMMKMAQAGDIGGVLVWKLDRFTRSPRDMEDLIELADRHGVRIDGPMSGHIDLTTAAGRQQARGAANQAAAESDNTSERCTAGLYAAAEEGVPMGAGRMFGFAGAHGDERAVVDSDEAKVVREMARRVLAGEPLMRLAAELNDRGLVTTRGGRWNGANLGRMLGQHRYGGKVEMKGVIVGTIPGEPILDADTYEQVQVLLASRRRGRKPSNRFVLTGIASCTNPACGGRTLTGATASKDGRRMYRCAPHVGGCGQSVSADRLEAMVDEVMIAELADPKNSRRIAAKDAALGAARVKHLKAIEDLEGQLVDLEVKKATGELIPAAYNAAKPVLDRRLAKVREALNEVGTTPVLHVDAVADWADAEPAERRLLIRRYGVVVTVTPPAGHIRFFDPSRVSVTTP